MRLWVKINQIAVCVVAVLNISIKTFQEFIPSSELMVTGGEILVITNILCPTF